MSAGAILTKGRKLYFICHQLLIVSCNTAMWQNRNRAQLWTAIWYDIISAHPNIWGIQVYVDIKGRANGSGHSMDYVWNYTSFAIWQPMNKNSDDNFKQMFCANEDKCTHMYTNNVCARANTQNSRQRSQNQPTCINHSFHSIWIVMYIWLYFSTDTHSHYSISLHTQWGNPV